MDAKTERAIRVIQALADDPRTEDVAVSAIDNNSVIMLSGTAPSQEAKQAAIEIAEEQEGVNSVIPDIRVEDEDATDVEGITTAPYTPRQGGST